MYEVAIQAAISSPHHPIARPVKPFRKDVTRSAYAATLPEKRKLLESRKEEEKSA